MQDGRIPTVTIIGRPNVGKSTLYNRLTGTRHAITHDLPGVTRDRREGMANIAGLIFKVIDTAGLEERDPDALETRMFKQTEKAVEQAVVNLFMIDGRAGVTALDKHFAKWLRKKNTPSILLVNKCEGVKGEEGFADALGLGFPATIAISAEHNEGMAGLYEVLSKHISTPKEEDAEALEETEEVKEANTPLQLAVIGRPNTGKSTFINKILQEERVLTGPEAGITRDAIAIDWEYHGQKIRLIDTAGMRKKAKITDSIEKLSVSDTQRAIQYAHVVIAMIDATMPMEKQDVSIIDHAVEEGRGIVIALNKWDLVKNKKEELEEIHYKLGKMLPQIGGVPVVTISALKGEKIHEIIKACLKVYKLWNIRITTTKLNQWLKEAESVHTPPLSHNNRRIKLKYITQHKTRPPTFTLFMNIPEDLPLSYSRYLVNSLREYFNLPGIPLRLHLKKQKNPYAEQEKS